MADSNTMKRLILIFIYALLLNGAFSFAQENKLTSSGSIPAIPVAPGTIRLENDTEPLVFYTVVPLRNNEFVTLTAQVQNIIDRLQERRESLEYLAGGAVAPAIKVTDAEQIIIGFTVEPGSSVWPVWYLRIPPLSQRPSAGWYSINAAKPLQDTAKQRVALRSVDFDLPTRPIRIDGRFVDWLKFPDSLSFAENALPLVVTQQSGGQLQRIQPSTALSFRKAGTDMEHIRVLHDAQEVFLMISSRTLMSPGLSYLIRLFATDTESPNRYTIEIPLDGPTGPVLLWINGRKNPIVIGTYATADHSLEARFSYNQSALGLEKLFNQTWVLEFASQWNKSGISEEFVWGRLPATQGLTAR